MNALVSGFVRYALLAPIAALLLVAACSPVTAENYAEVRAGMSRDEVYDILGKPDEVTGGGVGQLTFSSEIWNGRKQTISVTFSGDTVALKSIGGLDREER